jgi:L-aminopeptidase/D-esterase-like protein
MIPGVRVGHWTDLVGLTGCTVIVPPPGSVASAEVRGLAPGTRELALLDPVATVDRVDAIVLTGGSAFGLAAADGVLRALAEEGVGFPTPAGPVPIVPAAVIFDRVLGAPVAPDAAAGAAAYRAAVEGVPARGVVGAGTGATVAGARGGLGYAELELPGGARIAAIAVANAFGDVVDEDGTILAGRPPHGTERAILSGAFEQPPAGTQTTLICVLTDADVDKLACHRLARAAHAGIARATRPAATMFDGDTAFAVATRRTAAPSRLVLEAAAARVAAGAIRDAVAPR